MCNNLRLTATHFTTKCSLWNTHCEKKLEICDIQLDSNSGDGNQIIVQYFFCYQKAMIKSQIRNPRTLVCKLRNVIFILMREEFEKPLLRGT